MLRNIGAVIAGIIAGSVINMGFIMLNSYVLFPMPEGMDMNDPAQFKTYIATLPVLAFFVVLVAHQGQALVGGWVAARIGSKPMVLSMIIGVLTLLGVVYNQITLDAPLWMWIDAPLCIVSAWFVANIELKRRAAGASE
jgi:hypothetical protein